MGSIWRRAAATTAALAAGLCVGWTTLGAQQAPVPTFKSGVELVTVDVGVVDRQGQPVRGLAPGDFSVTVGGQPRKVVSAEYVGGGGDAARSNSRVPPPGLISTNEGAGVGRLFVFVVDQSTLEAGSVRHVGQSASRFLSSLSFADRSALMVLPAGPNLTFTWAHDKIRDGLGKVVGQAGHDSTWEFGSLTEARDIANRNISALRMVGQRECGAAAAAAASGFGGGGLAPPPPAGAGGSPGGGTTQGGTGGGAPAAPGGTTGGTGQGSTGGGSPTGQRTNAFGENSCTRDVQMRAEWTWRGAQMTSLTSISSLRQLMTALSQVRGDKTVVLISGGWPLDDREQHTLMTTLAADAAAARATLYTVYVPATTGSASRRTITSTPANDSYLHSGPLDTLASMTGGGSYRADVGADAVFDRLGRELSGFYRVGVEKEASDADGKGRRMKVQVGRTGTTVRAREIFDVRTYEDRDWAARLASALEAPIPATSLGVRLTSYVTADSNDPARVRLVLSGEASRVDPGEATVQLLLRDMEGAKVLAGEQPIGEPRGDGLSFTANVTVTPGSYVARVAVIDGAGRVGSVDHRVDARRAPLGSMSSTGPLLLRVPPAGRGEPRIALDTVSQDERLAMQIELDGDSAQLQRTTVDFEVASAADGPSLLQSSGTLVSNRTGSMLAQGVNDMRELPPGSYIVRARVKAGTEVIGEVQRPFTLTAATLASTVVAGRKTAGGDGSVVGVTNAARSTPRLAATVPRFAVDQVLAPDVLGAFLDRVAARSDASSPMIRDLVRDARGNLKDLYVSDVLSAESPVAAFLKGVSLLSQNKLEPAAASFRSAMRASADFYPAMVYLGACYAAGGNDKEAAGAWRTAMIKEAETLPLHTLLADALLRQENGSLALETLDKARARWPDHDGIKRRFVLAAMLAGEFADGLATLDDLVARRAEDESSLAAGLIILYEAFRTARPIATLERDREQMVRLAEAYRVRGGPALPLIETWLEAMKK